MKKHELGQHLTVSAIGLGCMPMSGQNYGQADRAEAVRTLHRALDLGLNLFDTAATYGHDHANEKLLGQMLGRRREEVILSTKFGLQYKPGSNASSVDSRPETIVRECEESLTRLQTDHIDLYYQHRVDPSVPIEEVWGVLSELVAAGKVRYLGMSEPGMKTLRRAHAVHPVTAVQNEYSLFSRDPEAEVLPTLRELGIGLVCYAPLGRGFLSGTFRSPDDFVKGDDVRRLLPRFQGENFYKNVELVDRVHELAAARGVTAMQLALAWLLARGGDIVPIPGMETVAMLEENLVAAEIELGADELDAIDAVLPTGAVGSRLVSHDASSNAEAAEPTML
jgi:aryl-alcohol dehydrogenase-like predicted oxidoreductase